ncbi:hypothetical protein [Elstera cyanobacteriorum]|uniref:bestrophin-like domain n=1 Tax=Elstera cyanobacteriorum TaxID=2022747 RepID=UPI002355BF3D|nr:hypothetical protein [Elstera cyanobacteriorum]MCK6443827.1 hypothetical protein [Elstera cyanobacteriorum]
MIALPIYPLSLIFCLSLVLLLAALEAGRWFGRRALGRDDVTTLEAAVLGLLALMIGFSVSLAIGRFEARRDTIVDEGNAIGTLGLRATLLGAAEADAVLARLIPYTEARLTLTASVSEPPVMQATIDRSNAILMELWARARQGAGRDPQMVPTGLYVEALNALIDMQEKRLNALRSRVPSVVLLALYGVAAVACGFMGYAVGLNRRRQRGPVYVVAILIAAVVLLIQDLDRPGTGFITVSQKPLLDTLESLKQLR